jgi:hypothetical protein
VHDNVFDLLPAQVEEVVAQEDTEEVDITGYTGRSQEERSESNSSVESTANEGEGDLEEDLPQVAMVQRSWIGGVPVGTRSGLKSSQREGVLKVRFSETPVMHWYIAERQGLREWERPVSAFRHAEVQRKVREALKAGRANVSKGHENPSGEEVDPYFILEEVSSSPTPVVAAVVSSQPQNPVSPREEAFLHSWFERESAPFVLAVVDSEGLKYQIPKTLREAKLSPQWPMWKQACIDELDSIDKHHTQKLVTRPPDKRVLPTLGSCSQN